MTGGGFSVKKPRGSSSISRRRSGSSKEIKRCVWPNLSFKRVVFPDCRGPVTRIAGKVFMADRIVFSKVLGIIGWTRIIAIFNVQV